MTKPPCEFRRLTCSWWLCGQCKVNHCLTSHYNSRTNIFLCCNKTLKSVVWLGHFSSS